MATPVRFLARGRLRGNGPAPPGADDSIYGNARLGRKTKLLVKRLGADDVAIVDHADLDRVAA